MEYLLDTDMVGYLLTRGDRRISRRLNVHRSETALSSIAWYELVFGAFNSNRVDGNLADLATIGLPILPFEERDAHAAGELRARLKRLGTPIGPYDLLIAGQALARGMTVVTANLREFQRVDGLAVENWMSD